ncbi:MAG: HAD-IIIC family phosphatase [Fibrobacteria bacterium]
MEFKRLKANLKRDFSGAKRVKAAVLGDSATQLLCLAMRGYGYEQRLDLEIYEAGYDLLEREILDPGSGLYAFDPDFTLLFPSTPKLHKAFLKTGPEARSGFASAYLAKVAGWWAALEKRKARKIIHFNFGELEDGAFGHYANKVAQSFLFQLRKINFGLMELAPQHGSAFINDIASLQSRHGHRTAFSPQLYINADMVFALDHLPYVAKGAVDIMAAALGSARKCLILDLDNTLWGGVIGDDGLEGIQIGDLGVGKAYSELQWWAKELKERGIVLAVCSKNDDKTAREPFGKHPDMVLALDDIAVFMANWENKPENIKRIQAILNIGFDSMVFLDDNPFEREMVRKALPEVLVPELPEDPAEYVPFLREANLFETASFSGEDLGRTRMYKEEAGRQEAAMSFASEEEFLAGLGMTAEVSPCNAFNTPRVAQLSQRSNQFNLRTVRYTDQEVASLADSPEWRTFVFNLRDKFGDYGLVSAILLRRQEDAWFIDTWIMSCRVLKRGMERFSLERLVLALRGNGARKLVGEYLPTAKNGLVKDHYANLDFKRSGDRWELDLGTYRPAVHFIKETTHEL